MAKVLLQYTKNYDNFIFSEDNRKIKNNHVMELSGSMERNGFIKSKAISVKTIAGSQKLLVIDGQHRLLAAKNLDIAVWYNIDNDIPEDSLADIQIAQKWTLNDFLKHFIAKNNENYNKIEDLHKKYPKISISALISVLANKSHDCISSFKNGQFKIKNISFSENVLMFSYELYNLTGKDFVFNCKFLESFMNICENKKYDQKIMIDKLKYLSEKFVPMVSRNGYLEMFENIYNYKSRIEKIKFL